MFDVVFKYDLNIVFSAEVMSTALNNFLTSPLIGIFTDSPSALLTVTVFFCRRFQTFSVASMSSLRFWFSDSPGASLCRHVMNDERSTLYRQSN